MYIHVHIYVMYIHTHLCHVHTCTHLCCTMCQYNICTYIAKYSCRCTRLSTIYICVELSTVISRYTIISQTITLCKASNYALDILAFTGSAFSGEYGTCTVRGRDYFIYTCEYGIFILCMVLFSVIQAVSWGLLPLFDLQLAPEAAQSHHPHDHHQPQNRLHPLLWQQHRHDTCHHTCCKCALVTEREYGVGDVMTGTC